MAVNYRNENVLLLKCFDLSGSCTCTWLFVENHMNSVFKKNNSG